MYSCLKELTAGVWSEAKGVDGAPLTRLTTTNGFSTFELTLGYRKKVKVASVSGKEGMDAARRWIWTHHDMTTI
ncbi:hypothetical protein E2C01_007426 [Portunus trituberculatus]|uniref:Uncharacterized protein n=1 Tax=Portunus trituberculatus TaxID=210409 RepID=A0A5B7D2D9_PORTR|nr:hypothetical protein [Portunus trituberculatus]